MSGYDEDGWEDAWIYDTGRRIWQSRKLDPKRYPHTCPFCGKPSYQGICPGSKVDCSAKCKESLK